MESMFNINCLPADIFIEIFSYLNHNELGLISRVCRKWNEYARSPVLWKNVNVKFSCNGGSQNEVASFFVKRLPPSITQLKIHFDFCIWNGKLKFEEFCIRLKENCPHLHTLILHYALFSVSLPTVIDLCSEFLVNLKVLILPKSSFGNYSKNRKYEGISKIEILDISKCWNVGRPSILSFAKMHCLKKLNLSGTYETDNRWFWYEDDATFLHQIEFLDLGFTDICSRNFRVVQNHAYNLTELFLCWAALNDDDFKFTNSAFPLLKTICLRRCDYVTCDGIVSLLQSCKSLQDVYVNQAIVESYVKNSYVSESTHFANIVKAIDDCHHYKKLGYTFD